ncbi:hypothetical protein JOM56_001724 [Amanita muscaria]
MSTTVVNDGYANYPYYHLQPSKKATTEDKRPNSLVSLPFPSLPSYKRSVSFPSTSSRLSAQSAQSSVTSISAERSLQAGDTQSPLIDCASVNTTPSARKNFVADILKKLGHLWHDQVQEYDNATLSDFLQLQESLAEEPGIRQKLKIYYLREYCRIMVEWPSPVHEFPLIQLSLVLNQFQPHVMAGTYMLVESNLKVLNPDCTVMVPDLAVSTWSQAARTQRYPVLVECARSQTLQNVLSKFRDQLQQYPEAIMAIVIHIPEQKQFRSPAPHSDIWHHFKNSTMLSQEEFRTRTTLSENRRIIKFHDHTWCNFESIDFHVWLKQGEEYIDIDKTDDMRYYVRGSFPETMAEVTSLIDEGLERVNEWLQDLGKANDPDADTSTLESLQVHFPSYGSAAFENFREGLFQSFERTAYERFRQWFADQFRQKRGRESDDDESDRAEPKRRNV